jgi:phytoene/squalene synthetase
MLEGAPLATRLPGRIGWELRLVVQGGLRILEAIERADYDVFRRRPRLKRRDWPVRLLHARSQDVTGSGPDRLR